MSVRISTPIDKYNRAAFDLPEARAVCDACGMEGPPVECREPRLLREYDGDALRLAVVVAAFHNVLTYNARGKARGEHRCKACVKASEMT
jgi:hypothetical protein